jgi:hypothetical protein
MIDFLIRLQWNGSEEHPCEKRDAPYHKNKKNEIDIQGPQSIVHGEYRGKNKGQGQAFFFCGFARRSLFARVILFKLYLYGIKPSDC